MGKKVSHDKESPLPGELDHCTILDSVRLLHRQGCSSLEVTYAWSSPPRSGAAAINDSNMRCSQQACVSSSHMSCTLQLTSLVLCKAAMHMCVRRPVVNSSSVLNQLASQLDGL